jgi:hypothetical protein
MKQLRSPRQLIKNWHRREKATVDHLVRTMGDAKSTTATTHSPFTSSGLAIEDQIRKACGPSNAGLPVF